MLQYKSIWGLRSELFEWVFAVETKLPSKYFRFLFREHVCFKRWCKSFLKNLHFSADVEDWNRCLPQFDSCCSFLFALLLALCVTVSISLCPCKHLLCLSNALVYSQYFVKLKFLRWKLSYIPKFASGNKSYILGFFDTKSLCLSERELGIWLLSPLSLYSWDRSVAPERWPDSAQRLQVPRRPGSRSSLTSRLCTMPTDRGPGIPTPLEWSLWPHPGMSTVPEKLPFPPLLPPALRLLWGYYVPNLHTGWENTFKGIPTALSPSTTAVKKESPAILKIHG